MHPFFSGCDFALYAFRYFILFTSIFLLFFPFLYFSLTFPPFNVFPYKSHWPISSRYPPFPTNGRGARGYAYTYTLQSILHIERISLWCSLHFKAQWDQAKKSEMLKVVFIESYEMHVVTTQCRRPCSAVCIYMFNCHLWYFCEDDILQCRVELLMLLAIAHNAVLATE
jgi:hypothetical protein